MTSRRARREDLRKKKKEKRRIRVFSRVGVESCECIYSGVLMFCFVVHMERVL